MLSWTSISAIGKQLKVGSSYTTNYIYTYICMDPWWESIFIFIFRCVAMLDSQQWHQSLLRICCIIRLGITAMMSMSYRDSGRLVFVLQV